MKLTTTELNFIQTVIKTAQLINITSIIIEPGKIRAMDEDQTTILFQDKNIPSIGCGSIGLNRLAVLIPRLTLAESQDKFEVDVITTGDDPDIGFDKYDNTTDSPPMWARSLTMVGTGFKIEYRCASPQTIRAPKNRAGVIDSHVVITPEMVNMIQKGQSAMKADDVTINGSKKGVSIEIADTNGDVLDFLFSDEVIPESENSTIEFSYTYPIKLLLPVLKTNPTGTFHLTTKGSLIFTVNGLDVYILAKG